MTAMSMRHGPGSLGMWMAMMVPMMLPALAPMLSSYRRSTRGAAGMPWHALTVLAGAGYFTIWAGLGAAAWIACLGIMKLEMRWAVASPWPAVATGLVLLAAGGVQLSSWKARQLALCRQRSGCGGASPRIALAAYRHGVMLGVRCVLCCGSLMVALLAVGMMDLVAMAAVTLAISAERLAPAPLRVARAAGVTIVMLGVLTIARA